jgi:hypothetical protein
MQISLSKEAKKGILFQILKEAKDKFIPDGFVDFNEHYSDYEVWIKIQLKQSKFVKKGLFRKEKLMEEIIQILCIEIRDIHNNHICSDLDWGDLKIKSCNKDYDKVAEFIIQELSQYVPQNQLHLVINNSKKIEAIQNPSRR